VVLLGDALAHARAGRRDAGRARLDRALRGLASGRGPADTYVLGAVAASALGERDSARALAARARSAGAKALGQPATRALEALPP
jgi:hypothetical protein